MTRTPRALRMLTLCVWPLLQPCTANADAILDWNIVSLKTTAAAAFNPPLESRNLAIVHAAMFDAVNSIVREFHPTQSASTHREAHRPKRLSRLRRTSRSCSCIPISETAVDAAYADSLGRIPDGPGKTNGISLGEAVASKMLDGAVLRRCGRRDHGSIHAGRRPRLLDPDAARLRAGAGSRVGQCASVRDRGRVAIPAGRPSFSDESSL